MILKDRSELKEGVSKWATVNVPFDAQHGPLYYFGPHRFTAVEVDDLIGAGLVTNPDPPQEPHVRIVTLQKYHGDDDYYAGFPYQKACHTFKGVLVQRMEGLPEPVTWEGEFTDVVQIGFTCCTAPENSAPVNFLGHRVQVVVIPLGKVRM